MGSDGHLKGMESGWYLEMNLGTFRNENSAFKLKLTTLH